MVVAADALDLKYLDEVGQDPLELQRFKEVLSANKVQSYLEVGSKWGGSLWSITKALPMGSSVYSMDLPHGDRRTQRSLEACVLRLNQVGYDANLFLGDSTSRSAVDWATAHGPFDAIFVDANHTIDCVRQDFENYWPLAKKLIAFHDIGWVDRPGREGRLPIEVPTLWAEVKESFPRKQWYEIRTCHRDNGIGILFK